MDAIVISALARGESLKWTVTVSEDVSTALEVWFTVKRKLSDADASAVHIARLTTGGIVIAGAMLIVSIGNFAGSLTNTPTVLASELRVLQADGYVGVVGQGRIVLKPAVYAGA